MVAAEPGVDNCPLFYKHLEKEKSKQLAFKQGNFDSYMRMTEHIRPQIQWWIDNLRFCSKPISHGKPDLVINSDASLLGYGATIIGHPENVCSGVWSPAEQTQHINILELKACQYAILAFCKDRNNIHVNKYG